jgi:zinc transport system permease protein
MELLSYTFVQYAYIGGITMAFLAGLVGPFVVQSRQSIASDMFAHVALAGIGAALLVGVSPWWGALPTLLIVSTLIWALLELDIYSADALAMFFLSGGLAIALALVHIARDTFFSFESYLFGSILTLTITEVIGIFFAALCIAILLFLLWYPLLGATRNPSYLVPFNNTPRIMKLVFFWILAIVVWIGIKTIGGLLVGALLVIPVLTARAWTQSFASLVSMTTMISVGATILGLTTGLYVDLPPSSLIIGYLIVAFILQALLLPFSSKS